MIIESSRSFYKFTLSVYIFVISFEVNRLFTLDKVNTLKQSIFPLCLNLSGVQVMVSFVQELAGHGDGCISRQGMTDLPIPLTLPELVDLDYVVFIFIALSVVLLHEALLEEFIQDHDSSPLFLVNYPFVSRERYSHLDVDLIVVVFKHLFKHLGALVVVKMTQADASFDRDASHVVQTRNV
jgi:hypothetical protein